MLEVKELQKEDKLKILSNLYTYKSTVDIYFQLLRSDILRQPVTKNYLEMVRDCTNSYGKVLNSIGEEEYDNTAQVRDMLEELNGKVNDLLQSAEMGLPKNAVDCMRETVGNIVEVTNRFIETITEMGEE